MKSMNQRAAFFFLIYFVIAFLLVLGFTFLTANVTDIVPIFETRYKVNTIFLNYFLVFPALQISSIMVAYSWFFSADAKTQDGRDTSRVHYLRSILFMLVVCVVLSVVATEIVRPILQIKQTAIENASHDYGEFSSQARAHFASGNFDQADLYAKQALRIDPNSESMKKLQRESEIEASKAAADAHDFVLNEISNEIELNIPVQELIRRAASAYEKKYWFEAHYYSVLAQQAYKRTGDALSKDEQNAMYTIAVNSWKELQAADSTLGGKSETMFSLKRQGYSAILLGDYMRAYYIFRYLLNESGEDPDVKRYLAIAEESLSKEYFFIDETFDLQPFELVRNVNFSIKNKNGSLLLVGIKGICTVTENKKRIHYLRGVHIVSYNSTKAIEEDFYVPYAKLTASDAKPLGALYEAAVESNKNKTVPFMIIQTIDRDTPDSETKPIYYTARNVQTTKKTTFALPISYADFELITKAAQGADDMPLVSMAQFCKKATTYGFSREVFFLALCKRLCEPFLFIVLALASAIVAWKYRLTKNQMVHFWWLLTVPLFSVLTYALLLAIEYFQGLLICALHSAIGWGALPTVIVLYLAVFVVLCLWFASLKTD